MTMMTILFILVILLKSTLVDFILKMKSDSKKEQQEEVDQEGIDDIEARSQRTLTKSYKLEKNPDYFEIIAIMRMLEKKKKRPRESIQVQNETQNQT